MPGSPQTSTSRWKCGCGPTQSLRAKSRDEVPLSTALALMVRERLTGAAPPPATDQGMALVRDWIEQKAGGDLDALGLAIDDQRAFASLATKLLEDLELIEGDMLPDESDEGGNEDEGSDEQKDDQGDDGENEGDDGQGEIEARGAEQDSESEDGEGTEQGQDSFDDMDGEPGDEGEEGMLPVRPNRPFADPSGQFDYKAWTTAHDEVIAADRSVRCRRTGAAALVSRPAARAFAGGRDEARQPAATPPDGAAESQLGFRSGGGPSRRGAARADRGQPHAVLELQDRTRDRFSAIPW